MNEIIFEGPDDLYNKIGDKALDGEAHKPLISIHATIRMFRDPNTCSCKKGKKVQDKIVGMYMSLPPSIRIDPFRENIKALFDNSVLVFKINGLEFARIE
jgi:hypothetical protein